MQTEPHEKLSIEQQLSYWKWDFTMHDLLSGELAYSLIYDNIRPDRVGEALATVGLEQLPNYFLLIQIDDYSSISKKLAITREFFQKDLVVNVIRTHLKESKMKGFAANLIGSERLLCFLCLEEGIGFSAQEFFPPFISALCQRVQRRTPYTLSVSVSGRCTSLSHYPDMYTQMEQNLDKSFYKGQNAYLESGEAPQAQRKIDDRGYRADLLVAISQCNGRRMQALIEEIFQELKAAQLPPQQVRIEVIRLIYGVEEYCVDCAIPEQTVASISRTCVESVLSSQFFSRIQALFQRFCEQMAFALERYSADDEYQFKTPVQIYLREHYAGTVRLEEIARTFGFSAGYFTSVFKQNFGMTLTQYLQRYRVEKSQELLRQSSFPIETIALQVGFNSYSYFCNVFKRQVGMTPKEYRLTGARAAPPADAARKNEAVDASDRPRVLEGEGV